MTIIDKELNGYVFYLYEEGLYHFSKREDDYNNQNYGKYLEITVSEEQLHNGDLEFMVKHNLTLDESRQKQIRKNYRGQHNGDS